MMYGISQVTKKSFYQDSLQLVVAKIPILPTHAVSNATTTPCSKQKCIIIYKCM